VLAKHENELQGYLALRVDRGGVGRGAVGAIRGCWLTSTDGRLAWFARVVRLTISGRLLDVGVDGAAVGKLPRIGSTTWFLRMK